MVNLILSEFVTYTNQLHQIHNRLDEHSHYLLEISKNVQLIEEHEAIDLLNSAFFPRLKRVYAAIQDIPAKQVELLGKLNTIEQFLTILRYIYVSGKVEISRLRSSELKFGETFEQLRVEIDSAENHLQTLRQVMNENTMLFNQYEDLNERLSATCNSIH